MNKGTCAFLAFIAGTAAGFFIGKGLYSSVTVEINEETQTTRNDDSPKEQKQPEKLAETAKKKPDISEYVNYAKKLGYDTTGEEDDKAQTKPRIISPDEFGDDDYDTSHLTYYADHILADENDHAMTVREIRKTVGVESLERFGEYEDDSVFVRNDELKIDYEVVRDPETYAKVVRDNPTIMED